MSCSAFLCLAVQRERSSSRVSDALVIAWLFRMLNFHVSLIGTRYTIFQPKVHHLLAQVVVVVNEGTFAEIFFSRLLGEGLEWHFGVATLVNKLTTNTSQVLWGMSVMASE